MSRPDIVAHVHAALSAVLHREVAGLGPEVSLFDDLGLDSTSIIELLMSLEDTTSLEIDPDELLPEVFQTVGSLSDYIEASSGRSGAGRAVAVAGTR